MPMTMFFPGYLALGYMLVIWWYTSIAAYTATAATPVYRVMERDSDTKLWIPMTDESPEKCVEIKIRRKFILNPS